MISPTVPNTGGLRDDTPLMPPTSKHAFMMCICTSLTSHVNRPGLMGGTRRPHQYRPLHIRLAPLSSRPKPRPAYGRSIANNGGEGAEGHSLKRPRDEDTEVEMPATKRRIVGRWQKTQTSEDLPTTDVPDSSGSLRRGMRTRTAVKF